MMAVTSTTSSYREITTGNRTYRVGESPKDILGVSRSYMVWLPWVAMMAAGVFEYAYGSAVKVLQDSYGWSDTATFTLAGVWGFFQAGIALPAGRLREKKILSPRAAMLIGAVCSLIAFVNLGLTSNLVANILCYGVIGGIGTGLVYATCINLVGKWFPEKKGARVGFVNGGFAYGSIPFIVIFSYWFSVGNHTVVLALVGAYMFILMAICGWLFKDPPQNWWPTEVDPENYLKNQAAAKNLKKNPPAAKQFTWNEAIRTWQIKVMWIALVATSGVSFFGINYQVKFAKASHFALYVAVLSAVLLALVNGTGRGLVGWLSDRLGRKQTLLLICAVLGIAQYGVGYAGTHHNQTLFFAFAVISGFGGGAFYPMFAIMTPDYFGENYNASNYGTVYSGKLLGAVCAGPLGAALIDASGYGASYILAGSLALGAGLLVLTLRRPTADQGGKAATRATVAAGAPAGDPSAP